MSCYLDIEDLLKRHSSIQGVSLTVINGNIDCSPGDKINQFKIRKKSNN